MSTDRDLSKGSGTEGPDEFDSVVLDENFIKGGVSEASLRRYQVVREQKWERPPRPSSPANGESSGPVGGPAVSRSPTPGPTDHSSPTAHLGTGESFSASGFGNGRPRSTGLLVGAAALVVALVVLTGLIRLGRGSAGSTGTGNLPVAAQAGPGSGQNVVLSASVPPGTCFNVPTDNSATTTTVTIVTCSVAHQYELADLQQGTGGNDQYPTQPTWTNVGNQCSSDLQTYTGKSSSSWPGSLYPAIIPPTETGWSKGDRTIYCVAVTRPSGTGSVRGSATSPTG
ncbi:septum formation family protein [Nakamurella sp. PAMC28650]|uniref:septum formation family protein n=1 Tax=Nakamurella sp. PAMC28650 TaxID=2762325 RepID=UPI00164D46F8|nr:septum formation family protein [Nakamurella sp. PAMC28650]QNK79228.1 septum formation family protein [Nakamurella sp. PAMC28650]